MAPMDRHVSKVQKDRKRPMSAYPQIHVRMETIGLPLTTVTILIHEDSLATIASHLDTLERLIAEYGAKAFFGEPDTEPPRETA
jgi:2-iminoacetate synthase ThiH